MLTTTATRGEEDKAAAPNAADDLILSEMRERYLLWQDQDEEFLKNSDAELEFGAGEHWKDTDGRGGSRDVRQELQSKGRSAMTIDLLNPSIELVVNPMRINKVMPKFMPVGEGAQQATADVRQGLYRNIDRESRAPVARETAYDFAVRCGRGYYQVLIEDEPGLNFDRRIMIQRIDNLGCVMIDQTCIQPDYSDAEWGGIWDDLSKREFKNEYGDLVDDLDVSGISLPEPTRDPWFKANSVRRLVYFRRVWFTNTVAKLVPGYVDPITQKPKSFALLRDVPIEAVVTTMKKRDYKIQRFEASGTQILRREDWKGRWIPIVVMVGRELFRGRFKKKLHSGMIRPAMDVSRVHNFAESRLIDEVALSPLPHMIAAAGQLDPTQEAIVNTINVHPWSVVTYTLKHAPDGTPIPRPEWVSPSPNLEAVVQAAVHAKDNLQRVLNTYSPQLGQMQSDQSGRAIREVKDQGDISHAAFPDNATRALLHEARIVNDLMDTVYSDARAITITELDDNTKRVLINQEYTDEQTGETINHLFGAGKYDVAMGTEQSYPTRLAEASDKLLDMAKVIPALTTQAPDLLIQAIGLPGLIGQKIADRLRPAGIDDKSPLPPVAQAKLAQMQKMIQMLSGEVGHLAQIIKEKRLEIAGKEKVAMIAANATLIAADFKYGSEEAQLQFKAAIDVMNQRVAQLDTSPETANPEATPPAGAAPPAPPPAGAPAMPPGPGGPGPGAPGPGAPPAMPPQ
jgi:CheY-like chemotaxis protein